MMMIVVKIIISNNSCIYSAEFLCFAQQRQLVDMEDGCADVTLLDCIYCPAHRKQGEHFTLRVGCVSKTVSA